MRANDGKYFSRSWAMMTRNKGWIKPLLVLAVAQLVPVVGMLGALGYALEWARLSAWGVDASPKQRGVRVGECIASGWRGFVVVVVWMIPWAIVVMLLRRITGASSSDFVSCLLSICTIVVAVVAYVAALRAAIYTKITAGLKPARVIEMVRRSPDKLFRIALIPLVATLIDIVVIVVAVMVLLALCIDKVVDIASLATYMYYATSVGSDVVAQMLLLLAEMITPVLIVLVLFGFPVVVIQEASLLLEVNSIGLWMAQFDVASWGGADEALPVAEVASNDGR